MCDSIHISVSKKGSFIIGESDSGVKPGTHLGTNTHEAHFYIIASN